MIPLVSTPKMWQVYKIDDILVSVINTSQFLRMILYCGDMGVP